MFESLLSFTYYFTQQVKKGKLVLGVPFNILVLLELLAESHRVLVCSWSQNFRSYLHTPILVKDSVLKC